MASKPSQYKGTPTTKYHKDNKPTRKKDLLHNIKTFLKCHFGSLDSPSWHFGLFFSKNSEFQISLIITTRFQNFNHNYKGNSCTPHYQQPFEIPDSWEWVELGEIGVWQSGSTPSRHKPDYYGGNIPWLKTGDLNDDYITDIPEYITEKAVKETSVKINPTGSVLIAMYGATIGKIGILTFPATTNQACCACSEYSDLVETKYLFYFLKSHKDDFIRLGMGGAQPNISKEKIVATPFPLPPKQEQIRIVAEIEQWFNAVATIEEGTVDIARLTDICKSKILSLAISGKLVPQDPKDEPALDLLRRINPKFTPDTSHCGNLPKGWAACTIKDCCLITMGQSPDGDTYNSSEGIEFHQGKLCFAEKFLNESTTFTTDARKVIEPDSVVLCVRAPVGEVNIVTRKIAIGRGLCGIKPKEGMSPLFFYYWLQSLKEDFNTKATGTTFKAISVDTVKNEQIPLPPLNEQGRIVEKIEGLFGVLDEIAMQLTR